MPARMFLSVGDPLTDDELFAFTFSPAEDGLNGDGGADEIDGTPFPDTIFGFGGNDEVRGNGGEPGDSGIYLDDRIDGGSGADDLGGEEGNDLVHGRAGNDQIFGGPGNDALFGDGGNDTIQGGLGLDLVVGGSGNDTLYGEGDDDDIYGGLGRDVMSGGPGADLFHFVSTAESAVGVAVRDHIADFGATDTIDLSEIDAKAGVGGNQAFTFIGGAAFSAAGQIRVTTVGDDKLISGSTDGDTAAEFQIQLDGVGFALGAGDFVL